MGRRATTLRVGALGVWVPIWLFAGALIGCRAGRQTGATASTGSGGTNSSSVNGSSAFATGTGTGTGGSCALYQHTEVHKTVNLYIMFDKSSSMAGVKWAAAKTGLSAFVENPGTDSVQAALRFFPRPVDATACDQTAYMTPTVPFGPLPMNAPAIEAAMAAEMPDGFNTPMYPALGGAILEGIQEAKNNIGQVSAVLLITDGAPDGPGTNCAGVNPNDPQQIANLAATGLTKGVSTFVVGLPGVDQVSANLIAAAGGTTSAILVGTTNTAVEFQQALKTVSGQAIPCNYDVPAEVVSGKVELGKVNVETTPPMGMPQTVPFNQGCGSDGTGWQYDNPTKPASIDLCPATCAAIKAQNGASIEVVLGCSTILK